MNITPISSVLPPLPAATVTPTPATPVTTTSTDGQRNNITINLANNVLANSANTGNLLIANELAVQVDGSNNNITINETNNIVIGSAAQSSTGASVTPTLNPDGTISLGTGTGAGDTLIQEEIAVLVTKDTQKQIQAYQAANNLVQPVQPVTASATA